MSRFQKGQSIVEFAIVLPLFFLLLWGFVYLGMFFADYLMLNDVARSCAREASLIQASTLKGNAQANNLQEKYRTECEKRQNTTLYQKPTIAITEEKAQKGGTNVLVMITESLEGDSGPNQGLAGTFKGFLTKKVVKDKVQVEYRMYWEGKQ